MCINIIYMNKYLLLLVQRDQRHILKEYIDKNFALIEMKKLIKYKDKYSGRPLVKEEEGFYEKAEKKKIEPPKKLWNDGDESNDSIGG